MPTSCCLSLRISTRAGDAGLTPGPGRPHTLRGNYTQVCYGSLRAQSQLRNESPRTAPGEEPRSLQLEKAHVQPWRLSSAMENK